ncbi:MAG: hypothetical protein BGO36_05445 [Burkholderiales bacterium 68-10]|nr:MAG: hypothetical protein BGO36_05445 [Burkholderiales bacterium 68-10]
MLGSAVTQALGGLLLSAVALAASAQDGELRRCEFREHTQTVVEGQSPVLHVILSPRMPYALKEWRRMASVGQQAGWRVMAFRDPQVPDAEWQAATVAGDLQPWRGMPPMDLSVAQACRMLNHAPTVVLSRCGRVHPWPVWGVMPDAAWAHVLAARRADLEAQPCP